MEASYVRSLTVWLYYTQVKNHGKAAHLAVPNLPSELLQAIAKSLRFSIECHGTAMRSFLTFFEAAVLQLEVSRFDARFRAFLTSGAHWSNHPRLGLSFLSAPSKVWLLDLGL